MVFCFKRDLILLIIIVIASIILEPIDSEICCTPNVRTVLFSTEDLDEETCWTTDNVSLLLSRYLLQTILPKQLPKNIDSLSTFIDLCFGEVNSLVCDNRAHRLMVKSMSDTLGGYQQGYGLPITYELYYEGDEDSKLETVLKMISEQHEMQKILGTNGASWVEPLVIHDVVSQVEDFRIECSTSINYCNKIELGENSTPKNIPLPIVDDVDHPRALAFPLKDKKLHSLFSCSSENVLLTYYKTALCCLRRGCVDDIEYFQEKFKVWLKRFVVSHLNDVTFYPAYKGVLRVMKSVNNKNVEIAIMNMKGDTVLMKFQKVLASRKSIKFIKNVAIGVAALVVFTAVYPGLKFLVKNIYKYCRTKRKKSKKDEAKGNLDKVEEGRESSGSRRSREMYEHVRKVNEELRKMDQKRTVESLTSESQKISSFNLLKRFRGSKIKGEDTHLLESTKKSSRNDSDNLDLDVKSESVEGSEYKTSDFSDLSYEPREMGRSQKSLVLTSPNSSNTSIRNKSVIIDRRSVLISDTSASKNSLNPEDAVKSSRGTLEPNSPLRNSSISSRGEESMGNKLTLNDSPDIYEDMMYRRITSVSKKPDLENRFSSHLQERINPRKRSADSNLLETKDSLQMYDEMKKRMSEMLKSLDQRKSSVDSKRESIKSRDSLELYNELRTRMSKLSEQMKRRRTETTMTERESSIDPQETIIDTRESNIVPRETINDTRESNIHPQNSRIDPRGQIIHSRKTSIEPWESSIEPRDSSSVDRGSKRVSILDPNRDFAGRKSRKVSIFDKPLYTDESPILANEDYEDIHLRRSSDDDKSSMINFKSYDAGFDDAGYDDDDDDDDDDDEDRNTRTKNDRGPLSYNRNGLVPTDNSSANTPQTAIRMGHNVDDSSNVNERPNNIDIRSNNVVYARPNSIDDNNIDGRNTDRNNIDDRSNVDKNKIYGNYFNPNNKDDNGQLVKDQSVKDESNKMGYFY